MKWYDPRKGYGFIERPGEDDLFVHHTNLDDTVGRLEEGEHVEFEIGPGKRGEEARRVRRAALGTRSAAALRRHQTSRSRFAHPRPRPRESPPCVGRVRCSPSSSSR